ncbi:MAG: nucleotide sugar dehydrogenase [Synergistaceae bacterium]|jgi:UDPglucose 6-dehydrogenase|nr:nucleotide sugar dehydrogenase [Synergistaceae bacterium]
MRVSVVGLGKLGLCTAACVASKGHDVVGVDSAASVVEALNRRACPIRESGLPELLERSYGRMEFTADAGAALRGSDITLIIVPTPSGPDGAFENGFVLSVLNSLAPALKEKVERGDFHVVDVVSTVMPGSSEGEFMPLLEGLTGGRRGRDFGFAYNPEFIALGTVLRDFLNPDVVLIGASDERTAGMVRRLYESVCDNEPRFAVMSPTNAEIAKLALNCYVTMKITYANELARLCGAIDGADVDAVAGAVGADTRVGGRCLKGGLGFAGPCFPRDNVAFQRLAELNGVKLFLPPATVASNDFIVDDLFKYVETYVPTPSGRVALLGLSYKPGTHITERSQSLMLMDRLLDAGYGVSLHDPAAEPDLTRWPSGRAVKYADPTEAVLSADGGAVVLAVAHPEYAGIDWAAVDRRLTRPLYLIDCWRMFRGFPFEGLRNIRYVGLGEGSSFRFLTDARGR